MNACHCPSSNQCIHIRPRQAGLHQASNHKACTYRELLLPFTGWQPSYAPNFSLYRSRAQSMKTRTRGDNWR